jgi:nucleotide-binding universal stress UspA family protein
MPTFKNILCPVDFSPTSRRALSVASELAASSRGALVVAYVWSTAQYGGIAFGASGDTLQAMSDDDEKLLAEWLAIARTEGVPDAQSKLLTGQPWDEIVKLAAAPPAFDLIVMGTHGRGAIAHALLGSVAERVVRHAPCAVLVMR